MDAKKETEKVTNQTVSLSTDAKAVPEWFEAAIEAKLSQFVERLEHQGKI